VKSDCQNISLALLSIGWSYKEYSAFRTLKSQTSRGAPAKDLERQDPKFNKPKGTNKKIEKEAKSQKHTATGIR
jgi:hypothetical protein